jgi:hypothetical protein
MRYFFLGLLGFLLVLTSYTLFSGVSFSVLFFLYAASLYLFFFAKPETVGYAFLSGITIGVELLGTSKLGEGALLGVCILAAYAFFGKQLRFTSLFPRYIVALFCASLFYAFLLFDWHFFTARIPSLAITYFCVLVVSYFLHSLNYKPDHELL